MWVRRRDAERYIVYGLLGGFEPRTLGADESTEGGSDPLRRRSGSALLLRRNRSGTVRGPHRAGRTASTVR